MTQRLEVLHYAGVVHVYVYGGQMLGYVTPARLYRRFADGTWQDAETVLVYAKSDADTVETLLAVTGEA